MPSGGSGACTYRTQKAAAETKLGRKLSHDGDMAQWLIEWAAEVLTRLVPSESGKTSMELARGRRTMRPIAQFGEQVLYIPDKTDQSLNKSEAQFGQTTFLGLKVITDEVILGTSRGTANARTMIMLRP